MSHRAAGGYKVSTRVLGSLVLSALLSSTFGVHARAAVPVSAFFLEGWSSTVPNATWFVGPEGTITGVIDPARTLYVEATGPDNKLLWLSVALPDGQTVGTGTYTTGVGGARVFVGAPWAESCHNDGYPGSVTIDELQRSGTAVTKLTASFSIGCYRNPIPDPVRGVVRINSTVPFAAIRLSPFDHAWASPHDFGTLAPPAASDWWEGSVENVGTVATAVTASVEGSAFEVQAGGCSGTLAVGASCVFRARFAPSTGGSRTGTLHLATPSLAITDRTWALSGVGAAPTSLSLAVDTSKRPEDYPGYAHYIATLTPPLTDGTFQIDVDCEGGYHKSGYGTSVWMETAPGACVATASYTGGDGWLPSTATPVSFTMPARSSVYLTASSEDVMYEGATITVNAFVQKANAATPSSGTLSIIDLDTDEVLASGPISADQVSVSATRSDWTAGTHHLRGEYSGGGGIEGNHRDFDLVVNEDTYLPDAIVGTDAYVSDPEPRIVTQANDLPVDIILEKQLSNDGIHWFSFPYTSTHVWSIVDPATNGYDGDGPHTLYARFRDRAGNWSNTVSFTTVLDRGLPVAENGGQTPASGAALLATGLPVNVSWTGSDALSGIDHFTVQRSTDGGAWASVGGTAAGRNKTVGVDGSHAFRFRIVAVDRAGNAVTTSPGASLRLTALPDTSPTINYTGGWRIGRSKAFTNGTTHYATAARAKATFKVTGRGFSWIATTGPTRGSAKVYVNGVLVRTVSLRTKVTANRRLVVRIPWTTAATRTVSIVVVGTPGHARVDVDSIYAWR